MNADSSASSASPCREGGARARKQARGETPAPQSSPSAMTAISNPRPYESSGPGKSVLSRAYGTHRAITIQATGVAAAGRFRIAPHLAAVDTPGTMHRPHACPSGALPGLHAAQEVQHEAVEFLRLFHVRYVRRVVHDGFARAGDVRHEVIGNALDVRQ